MNSECGKNSELSALLSAMLDGQMTAAQESRLGELLRDNSEAQEVYVDCCKTHALLRQELGGRCDISSLTEEAAAGSTVDLLTRSTAIDRLLPPLDGPPASVPFPPIVLHPFSDQPSPYLSPLGGFVFSYSLAALIIGVGMLIGWACQVSVYEQVVRSTPPTPLAARHPEPELIFVGRVTGMVDCQWSDSKTDTVEYAYVPLGRKYALASGLMEITYDTGATVILEGPCTYIVESKTSGYLSVGRLTANVEKRGERKPEREENAANQQSTIGNHRSSSPLSSPPSPLFTVRTPTATVTDLGTEFGVEVDKSGVTESHVFRGKVLLAAVDSGDRKQDRQITLAASKSARIEREVGGQAFVARRDNVKLDPASFVRGDQFAARAKEIRDLPLKPFRRWQAFSDTLRKRDDLLAYYDFQREPGDRRDKGGCELLRNRAPAGRQFDGRLVGSVIMGMAQGRFRGKDALRFDYASDGVRVNIPGEFPRLTVVASISLERCDDLSGIFMTDDWDRPGQPHWQFVKSGTIKFALPLPDSEFQLDAREAADFGQWHLWTTVYDAPGGRVASYVDGRLLQEWRLVKGRSLKIDDATIGNWKPSASFVPRPLCGSIDEFAIFARALSGADIKQLYEGGSGTPQK